MDSGKFKEKVSASFASIQKSDSVKKLTHFAKANTWDAITAVILLIGIITFFFTSFFGAFLVGITAGLYFSKEILQTGKGANAYVEREDLLKSLVLGSLLVVLFFSQPALFIGVLVAFGVKQLIAAL